MNLNPLENKKNLYEINELFSISKEEEDYYYNEAIQNCEITGLYNNVRGYDYLLYTLTDTINWFIREGDEDYQGDIYYLGKDVSDKIYYLVQGYGSCSGCDSFLANEDSIEGLNELREGMKRNIKQFENLEEFKQYLLSDLSETQYWYYEEDFKVFIEKINNEFGWDIKIKEYE